MAGAERPLSSERLVRRLGTFDAVVIGLGSMIGAGVFVAVAPAAEAAGSGLLVGLVLAAVVAYCNATSSARLAARYPTSGGTYAYGRERLGEGWGFLAGWAFVVGKTGSCAAMALTFGAYAAPDHMRALAVVAVVTLTLVNYGGVRKTAGVTAVLVAVVLTSLALVVIAALAGGTADVGRLGPLLDTDVHDAVRAGGFLFFSFAGYARIATLAEEVVTPERTIPRAIPLALGITFAVYAVVAFAALTAVGPEALATATAPLATAASAGSLDELAPAARTGATVASLGVLLSLLAGVSRTAFAMAADRELPAYLGAVHPRRRTPHRADLTVGAVVAVTVAVVDVRDAIGFSAFTVLVYYAVTNAGAWTLPTMPRLIPRMVVATGFAGCALLALALPLTSTAAGTATLGVGVAGRAVARRVRGRSTRQRSASYR